MGQIFLFIIVFIPFLLTGLNLFAFLYFLIKKKEKITLKIIEVIAIPVGLLYLFMYFNLKSIEFVNWNVQLHNSEKHSIIAPDYFLSFIVLCLLAFTGYLIVRFIPAEKQSPIVSALGIALIYIGIGVCVVWCIQTFPNFALLLLAANYLLLFIKTIYIIVYHKNNLIQDKAVSLKFGKLSKILDRAVNLPWIALLLLIPLLGIVIALLFLFGQEPSSLIKAWTDTSDWNLSQQVAPQNILYDEHYLCTVAAGGHRNIVKPLRGGLRHGHQVIVNRQLCIANAFEQLLEEKAPSFHKLVRTVYDTLGYPISRHIHSKYLADAIYYLMKPLEYLFLLVLYTTDVNPENRIAVQYPHSKLPDGALN